MSVIGKEIRLRRLLDGASGKAVIIPMDHGVSAGPMEGLEDIRTAVEKVAKGGASAVVLHKGLVRYTKDYFASGLGLIVHLSASTVLSSKNVNRKVICGEVSEAIALGADAISVHTNIGGPDDDLHLEDLGRISTECQRFGMPLLVMAYPRGSDIKDPYDVNLVKHVARAAAELGADIVKTLYTGGEDTFREVVAGCPAPVIVAGGPKMDSDKACLQMVKGAMNAGAIGVSIGRNVFQHKDPTGMTNALCRIVFDGAEVGEAYRW